MLLTTAVRRNNMFTATRRQFLDAYRQGVELQRNNHTKNFYNTLTQELETVEARLRLDKYNVLVGLLTDMPEDMSYTSFRIPKASGGTRQIDAPNDALKSLQQDVLRTLQQDMHILTHDCAYAYCEGRSHYDALVTHQHANARWFLKLDIENFFPSTTKDVLLEQLANIWPFADTAIFDEELTKKIVDISLLNGVLPQGSPLSPFLSNLVMLAFDKRLSHLLAEKQLCYTRYADDILISSPYDFRFDAIVSMVEQCFMDCNLPYAIKRSKTRYGSCSGRNWNLGLMYTHDQRITIGSQKKKRLNAMVHDYFNNTDQWTKQEVQELVGQLGYLSTIEPEYYKTMLTKYEQRTAQRLSALVKESLRA